MTGFSFITVINVVASTDAADGLSQIKSSAFFWKSVWYCIVILQISLSEMLQLKNQQSDFLVPI